MVYQKKIKKNLVAVAKGSAQTGNVFLVVLLHQFVLL
jgi:hypothetical protein